MPNHPRATPSRRDLLAFVALGTATALGTAAAPKGLSSRAFAQAAGGGTGGPLPIGVVGSGHIGSTLGTLWNKAGHPVLFSSRHPEALKELVEGLGPLARAGTPEEAARFGEAVLLAVPYRAYPELGRQIGPALRGKVVLDAGNAVAARDGADLAQEARENGIGLTTAAYFPGARIVRAFNTLGYRVLEKEANRPGGRVAIPLAGDDQQALQVASQLVRDAGFDPVVVGPLARAADFALGTPMAGQPITAEEFRRRFGVGR